MLSKSTILKHSRQLQMRSSLGSRDRNFMSFKTDNNLVQLKAQRQFTTKEGQKGDQSDSFKRRSEKDPFQGPLKDGSEFEDLPAIFKRYKSINNLSQPQMYKAWKYERNWPSIEDKKTGLRFLNYEESHSFNEYKRRVAATEPVVQPNFNMEVYNDWKKEVDQETVRTMQKIEHYKRSELLLKAIQDRLTSAKTSDDQQALQEYLLTKIGYKHSAYPDFVGNQLTLDPEDARLEAKRQVLINAEEEALEFLNYNQSQTRDSVRLESKHAWDPDQYVPASEIDKVTRQRERELMSQYEYHQSRQKDLKLIMDKRLYWDDQIDKLTENQHQKLWERKKAVELLSDPKVMEEFIKNFKLTAEELKEMNAKLGTAFVMKNVSHTIQELDKGLEVLNEQKDAVQKETEESLKSYKESLKFLETWFKELQKKPQDELEQMTEEEIMFLGTPNFELEKTPSTSEGELAYRQKMKQKNDENSDDEFFKEKKTFKIERTIDVHAYNVAEDHEIKIVEEFLNTDPGHLLKMNKIVTEIEQLDEKLQKEGYVSDQWDVEENVSDLEAEKQLFKIEQKADYIEFAKQFLAENGEGLGVQEKKKLEELQNQVREAQMPYNFDSEASQSDFFYLDPKQLEHESLEQLERERDAFRPSKGGADFSGDETDLAELDYQKMLMQDRGTWEGQRRFELIDRVSQDAENDKLDQIKLKARNERFYDPIAALHAFERPIVIQQSFDNNNIQFNDVYQTLQKPRNDLKGNAWETAVFKTQQKGKGLNQNDAQQNDTEAKILPLSGVAQVPIESILNLKEASEMINQPGEDVTITLAQSGFLDEMRHKYDQAKETEEQIRTKRMIIALKVKKYQQKLDQIREGHDKLAFKLKKYNSENVEQQITPEHRKFDLINQEKIERNLEIKKTLQEMQQSKVQFKPEGAKVQDCERELYLISQMGLLKTKSEHDSILKQFEFVFDVVKEKRIELTPKIRGHMFEYLVLRNDFELANSQLKFLTSDMTEKHSPIDKRFLSIYLKNCLSNDKIDGIAYIVNFSRRYNVDCSKMPIHKFHSMLDFYLNHSFDMSKVMVFCKFYRKFYDDKMASVLLTKNKKNKHSYIYLRNKIFGDNEDLVDMRALSKFLVTKTGQNQILDPQTKEDSLWGLIDLFTQDALVYAASQQSKNNHIEPSTIASYFGYRFHKHDSLEKIFKLMTRLQATNPGKDLCKAILQQLKTYQASHNGQLPSNFSQKALRDVYYRLRSQKIDQSLSEVLLYLMQQRGMHAEVIDFCEKQPKGEMVSYYLTESLLQLPIKEGSYFDAIQKTGVLGTEENASKLTQNTKAVLLDQGPEAAYKFFQGEFTKMEDKAAQKKAFLVSLYDHLMPKQDKISFETFRSRYYKSAELASRFAKEAFVVNQMQELIKNKDYDEIENMLSFIAVSKEERDLLKSTYIYGQDTSEIIEVKNNVQKEILQQVQARKQELSKKVKQADVQTLDTIAKIMKDSQLTVFNEARPEQIEKVASLFDTVSQDEIEQFDELENNDFSPETIAKVLAKLGHNEEFSKKVIESGLADATEEVLQDKESVVYEEFTKLTPSEQGNLDRIKADYNKVIDKVVSKANIAKYYARLEKDPKFIEATKNWMFETDENQDDDGVDLGKEEFDYAVRKYEEYAQQVYNVYGVDPQRMFGEADVPEKESKQAKTKNDFQALTEQEKLDLSWQKQADEIDIRLKVKEEKYKQEHEQYFSTTQDEDEINERWEKENAEKFQLEKAYAKAKRIFVHEISDLSGEEDKVEPAKIMKELWDTIDSNTTFYFELNKDNFLNPQPNMSFFANSMKNNFTTMMKTEQPGQDFNPIRYTRDIQDKIRFEEFRNQLLYDRFQPNESVLEPQALRETIHDATIFHLKEELVKAMNKRKYEALPIVIELFNRIQRKSVNDAYRLEDFEEANVNEFSILKKNKKILAKEVDRVQVNDIGKTLKKVDILLNDSRSPIISALKDTSKYKTNALPDDIDEKYIDVEAYMREPVDTGAFERDLSKLEILEYELKRIKMTLVGAQESVDQNLSSMDFKNATYNMNQTKKKEIADLRINQNARIRLLYEEFNADAQEISADRKAKIMRDLLAIELGESFNVNVEEGRTACQFPVFYALDLINFGMKRDQPAAIRLGEKLLADSCAEDQAKLPADMQMAIKNYMLDYNHNLKYREAMKITGPIDSSRLYLKGNQDSGTSPVIHLDDPYWREFVHKNRRREDQWRNPTMLAYHYKQFGILGEIVDMQNVQRRYEQEFGKL